MAEAGSGGVSDTVQRNYNHLTEELDDIEKRIKKYKKGSTVSNWAGAAVALTAAIGFGLIDYAIIHEFWMSSFADEYMEVAAKFSETIALKSLQVFALIGGAHAAYSALPNWGKKLYPWVVFLLPVMAIAFMFGAASGLISADAINPPANDDLTKQLEGLGLKPPEAVPSTKVTEGVAGWLHENLIKYLGDTQLIMPIIMGSLMFVSTGLGGLATYALFTLGSRILGRPNLNAEELAELKKMEKKREEIAKKREEIEKKNPGITYTGQQQSSPKRPKKPANNDGDGLEHARVA